MTNSFIAMRRRKRESAPSPMNRGASVNMRPYRQTRLRLHAVPPLSNEQRQIGITILGKGLDFLFPYPFATAGKGKQSTSFLSLFLPQPASLLTSILHFDRLSGANPVPIFNPPIHPFPRVFSPRVSFARPFLSTSDSSDSRPYADFNLVWPRHRHVLIFLPTPLPQTANPCLLLTTHHALPVSFVLRRAGVYQATSERRTVDQALYIDRSRHISRRLDWGSPASSAGNSRKPLLTE